MKQHKTRGFVRPITLEEYRFECPSDSFAAYPYLVDLEAHNGRGECACRDWICKRHVRMQQGETNPLLITCKHEKRCLIFWLKRKVNCVYDDKIKSDRYINIKDSLFRHWINDQASESDMVKMAFREIRQRVREKRKLNKGRKELES